MSQPPQIPRLLAALLGVEPPPPSGPPRSVAPPSGAPVSARGGSVPAGTRGRGGRAISEGAHGQVPPAVPDVGPTDGTPEAPPAPRAPSRDRSHRAAPGAVRSSVRRSLATPEALRTGVVVAEILGRPRALRPYGTDGAV